MENIIYNELLCRGCLRQTSAWWRSREYAENKHSRKQCEIDFVVNRGPKEILYPVRPERERPGQNGDRASAL